MCEILAEWGNEGGESDDCVATPGLTSCFAPEANRVLDDGINEVFI